MIRLHRRAALSGLAAGAFAAFFGAPLRALAAAITAKATAIVNSVTAEAKDTGVPVPVQPDQTLPPEAEIVTAKNSGAELTYADGTILTIGQRSTASLGSPDAQALMAKGSFRFRGTEAANAVLASPLLKIEARKAEFVVAVADGQTICGVATGEITCTSIKKGTSAIVPAGSSIAWISGSFGSGVTPGVFTTGDIAVDQGIEAARLAWSPAAAPPPPQVPEVK
jgi:hypothetical protein